MTKSSSKCVRTPTSTLNDMFCMTLSTFRDFSISHYKYLLMHWVYLPMKKNSELKYASIYNSGPCISISLLLAMSCLFSTVLCCPQGYYQPVGGACQLCKAGTYSPGGSSTACSFAPVGEFWECCGLLTMLTAVCFSRLLYSHRRSERVFSTVLLLLDRWGC